MPTNEWNYKGVQIWLDSNDGRFRFRGKDGRVVTKTSLKGAQNAIDKEVGIPVVRAMNAHGEPLQIAKRELKQQRQGYGQKKATYYDLQGREVRPWGGIYVWNQELADKLADVFRREHEEETRRRDFDNALREERAALTKQAGYFDYEAAVVAANQKVEENGDDDN
jgi:hypothetical protein